MHVLKCALTLIAFCGLAATATAESRSPMKWPAGGLLLQGRDAGPNQTMSLKVRADYGICWLAGVVSATGKGSFAVVSMDNSGVWQLRVGDDTTATAQCLVSKDAP